MFLAERVCGKLITRGFLFNTIDATEKVNWTNKSISGSRVVMDYLKGFKEEMRQQ